jgi:hypothetical protein
MSAMANSNTESPFMGIWRNTNPKSLIMAAVEFSARTDGVIMRVEGTDPSERFEAPVEFFVDDDAATAPEKIMVNQDLGSFSLGIHGWIKQGVLVLAVFRKIKDGSGRSSYFDREFFYKVAGPR